MQGKADSITPVAQGIKPTTLVPIESHIEEGVTASHGDCYVCFEGNAPRSSCKCTDRFLHVECQLKQIVSTNSSSCPVCLDTYANVKMRHTWSLTPRARKCILSAFIFVAYAICLSLFHPNWKESASSRAKHNARPIWVEMLQIIVEVGVYVSTAVCAAWQVLRFLGEGRVVFMREYAVKAVRRGAVRGSSRTKVSV